MLVYPNAGTPAAVIDFELLIASGIKRFVAFGTCGIFDANIPQNSIIVPTFAVREEGMSYHYLLSDTKIKFLDKLIEKRQNALKNTTLQLALVVFGRQMLSIMRWKVKLTS